MAPKRADFSEFSYGYALTSELVDRYKLRQLGYPLFPSLTEEGKKGGGFDVKLPGVPLFFQFKVPEILTGSRATDAATLGLPHFRMRLRPLKYSDQHNLLLAPRAYRRKLRSFIHLVERYGPGALREFGITNKDPKQYLRGKIAFAVYLSPKNIIFQDRLKNIAW